MQAASRTAGLALMVLLLILACNPSHIPVTPIIVLGALLALALHAHCLGWLRLTWDAAAANDNRGYALLLYAILSSLIIMIVRVVGVSRGWSAESTPMDIIMFFLLTVVIWIIKDGIVVYRVSGNSRCEQEQDRNIAGSAPATQEKMGVALMSISFNDDASAVGCGLWSGACGRLCVCWTKAVRMCCMRRLPSQQPLLPLHSQASAPVGPRPLRAHLGLDL
jgi:hypothetical protein